MTFLFVLKFSEVRTFLAEQLQPLSIDEQKEWLSNITTHIQSQGLSTPNVEITHIELAIKVKKKSNKQIAHKSNFTSIQMRPFHSSHRKIAMPDLKMVKRFSP